MIAPSPYVNGWPRLEGFVDGLPDKVYHVHESISKSGLDLVSKSPAHYKNAPPREPTPAMLIGTAIHRAVLEPDRFHAEYVIVNAPDKRQKEYKEAVLSNGVERVLLAHEAEHVESVRDAVHAHPQGGELALGGGWRELSAFTQDPETGVNVRCRYDLLLNDGTAVDLKKARDVLPHGFAKSCASFRYHVQVAFYSDIYYWLTGERLKEFWLLAVEDSPPYTVVPYRLDDISIEAGRIAYRRDLNTYAACLESGEWPKFEPESDLLALPMWALEDLEDELEI